VRGLPFVLIAALVIVSSASAQPSWPSERPPRPLPARDIKFPPYEIRTLKNGLQVIVVLHHEQPAVSLRLIVRAGGALDPNDKPGVASLAATLLDQGTTTRTATEIADAIMEGLKPDGVGVVIEAEHMCMTMRGIKKAGARVVTSALRGIFSKRAATRAEFMSLINQKG